MNSFHYMLQIIQVCNGAALSSPSSPAKDLTEETIPEEGEASAVEVQFSPQEFFDSSTRLAHLDLDGFEQFVGNTLEKAIRTRQKQKRRLMVRQKRFSIINFQ